MSVNVKPMQLVIAMDTDAAVFKDYKGAGLETIIYAANTPGDILGQATGFSFPGTGVDFDWVELFYIYQIGVNFWGVPQLERRIGYTPSTHVRFEDDPKNPSTTPTTTTPTTTPTTGGTTGTTVPTTGTTIPDIAPTTGKVTTPLTGSEKIVKKSSGLPPWAYWVLGGLGAIALILTGVAVARANKKGGKK